MSDYFADVRSELRRAVDNRAHLPWHRRRARSVRSRALIVVIGALVVATPAVGAVTNWFGIGAPNHPQSEAQAFGVGNAIRGTTKLLPLRVQDPKSGPPWGVRVVSTQTGGCQEIGRVEDGQLGSLGVDDYWHNDHLFHPFPRNWVGQSCSSGGNAVGGVQLGVGATQFDAGANIASFHNGVQINGCSTGAASQSDRPLCSPGSARFLIWGLLGSTVKSIRYELPNHSLATERTAGRYGEVLLVFPLNAKTCRLYLHGNLAKGGHCARTLTRQTRPFFTPFAAIKAITYRNGQTCPIRGPGLLASAVCPKAHKPKAP
jgi:hypothetical protein